MICYEKQKAAQGGGASRRAARGLEVLMGGFRDDEGIGDDVLHAVWGVL